MQCYLVKPQVASTVLNRSTSSQLDTVSYSIFLSSDSDCHESNYHHHKSRHLPTYHNNTSSCTRTDHKLRQGKQNRKPALPKGAPYHVNTINITIPSLHPPPSIEIRHERHGSGISQHQYTASQTRPHPAEISAGQQYPILQSSVYCSSSRRYQGLQSRTNNLDCK